MLFLIKNEPLRFSVVFHLGGFDKQKVSDFLTEIGSDPDIVEGMPDTVEDNVNGHNWRPTGYASSFVWIKKIPETREDEGTVVHEIEHALCWALSQRNINDEECKAYLLDYFYSTVMTNIDNYKNEQTTTSR